MWFFFALLLSPLFAGFLLLIVGEKEPESVERQAMNEVTPLQDKAIKALMARGFALDQSYPDRVSGNVALHPPNLESADQLFLMDNRGRNVRQITERGGDNPSWSPDGSYCLFRRNMHRSERCSVR